MLAGVVLLLSGDYTKAQRVKSSTKAGEQRKAEKGLKDNRYFIYFLNTTVTNFGTDTQHNAFREIVQRDIFSQFLYMKYMFYESFSEIRKCQKNLIVLYREFLRSDIEMAKKQLDDFAPIVIASKDPLARLYLRLGYREAVSTSIEMGMGDHYRETLYSMRLYKYVKAIKRIKEAKKYAFYAAIRARQTEKEKRANKPFTYDDVEKKLSDIVSPADLERFRIISIDSFYKSKEPVTSFDAIWEKPELESLDDFKKYLESEE
jgi:hypothetical protein